MKDYKISFILLVFYFQTGSLAWPLETENQWNGNWFPHPEGQEDTNAVAEFQYNRQALHDEKHGIKMGVPSTYCDDGKLFLQQDWLDDPVNYTCFYDKRLFLPREDLYPIFINEHVPTHYVAQHKCMDKKIVYDNDIPTFGPHRPLWAKFGEYKFLPKQRWLHNLEHGSIVMLYHPCAIGEEINLLRQLVVNCLYRHIITPYNLLPPERPLALVAWGKKLLMSKVDPGLVQQFIIMAAKHGPEQLSVDGQYDYELLQHAAIVTNKNDDILCSDFSNVQTME